MRSPKRELEALEHQLGTQFHQVPVLERARLPFVGVHDHDARRRLSAHRLPFAPGGEARAAHSRQAGLAQHVQKLARVHVRDGPALVRLEQEAVRAVGDAPCDRLALEPHRCEVAMAEARDLQLACLDARAGTVAHRPRTDARRGQRNAKVRVEGGDLVHIAAPEVHRVGQRVGQFRRDRPDLAANPAEVVEEVGTRFRELAQQGWKL